MEVLQTLGDPYTDEEIEAGTFEVTATVGGEPWWLVLEMEPADILLKQEED